MTFRHSETLARQLPNLGTLILAVMLLSPGCASRGGHSWYRGPEEYKWPVRAAFDRASVDFAALHPERPLRAIDWKAYRVEMHIEPTVRTVRGVPHIASGVPGLAHVQAQSALDGRTLRIWAPQGVSEHVLTYEAGRLIALANGIQAIAPGQAWSAGADQHWRLFPKFFRGKYKPPGY